MADAATARRIRVVGISGSGKSRLAAQIAMATGLARLELDAVSRRRRARAVQTA
ncbi:AAA family ATPase [Microbacterium sp. P5_E9]